jgi:hypothetical protein
MQQHHHFIVNRFVMLQGRCMLRPLFDSRTLMVLAFKAFFRGD